VRDDREAGVGPELAIATEAMRGDDSGDDDGGADGAEARQRGDERVGRVRAGFAAQRTFGVCGDGPEGVEGTADELGAKARAVVGELGEVVGTTLRRVEALT
jgi:hypothetical protein